jgi:hypothetical protein
VHFAPLPNAFIADCNPSKPKKPLKCLFLKDLTEVKLLARRLLYLFSIEEHSEPRPMNSTLLLANAIALVVLVSSQFIPESSAPEPLVQRIPHYLQVQRTPQLAVLSDQVNPTSQAVSISGQTLPALTSEHLVF